MRQPSRSGRTKVEPSDSDVGLVALPTVTLETIKLAGERPDFTARPLARFADPENQEVWFYWHDYDANLQQISKCNLKSKRWTNMTKRFSFVEFPWSPVTAEIKIALPVNFSGAVTGGIKLAGHRVLLHFGGEDEGIKDQPVGPHLTVFDLDTLKWWRVDISIDVFPRLGPFMVFADNSLYIFGGRAKNESSDDDEPKVELIESYSIAKFDPSTHRWSWVVQDKPYPDGTPVIGYVGDAIAIHDGKKILLTPGMVKPGEAIDITPDQLVVFDTVLQTFQILHTMSGQFPKGVTGYDISSLPRSNGPMSASAKSDDDASSNDAVLIASWENFFQPDVRTLPELWLMTFSPTPQCRHLDVELSDLGLSLSVSAVISDGRTHLFGSRALMNFEESFDACLILSQVG